MVDEFAEDEFALGTGTLEGIDAVISFDNLTGIPEVSNNERYKIQLLLAEHPTKYAAKIRALYGINKMKKAV